MRVQTFSLREEGHHHTSIADRLKLVHLSGARNILKINTGRYKIYSFLKNHKNSIIYVPPVAGALTESRKSVCVIVRHRVQ